MRILLLSHIENASDALKGNRIRTFLTTLGITLGVACMTTILSLSSGAHQLLSGQVESIGGNIAVIRPGSSHTITSLSDVTTLGDAAQFSASSLTEQDYNSIAQLPDVKLAAPMMSISGSVKSSSQTVSNSTIIATTPALEQLANITIPDGEGQFIDSVTNSDTIVLGHQLSINLFGTDQSIGKTLSIRGQQFTVIGVLQPVDAALNYNHLDFNNAAFISLDSGKAFNQGIAQLRQITIQTTDDTSLTSVTKKVASLLSKNHSGDHDFTILTGDEIARPTSQLFQAIAAATSVIAIVSLVIGGIGIMNIMLVSVAERTREIGIRKAVGASGVHITMQFLIESLVMSLAGGICGYLLGYAAAFGLSTVLPFIPVFTWQIAAVAIGLSVVIGVIFGLYPALRAARKNPIEALRQYY